MGILGSTTTVVGPIGTTAYNCFDHEKGTFKFTYNEKKAVETLKKAGTTSVGTALSGTLQLGGEISTTYLNDMYAGAMSIDQIEEMERLLEAKEREFVLNRVSYDLAEVDPIQPVIQETKSADVKILERKL